MTAWPPRRIAGKVPPWLAASSTPWSRASLMSPSSARSGDATESWKVSMRVVTWNMGRNSGYGDVHDAAWHHLLDGEPVGARADLALVQEAVVHSWVDD